ncbi:type IV secretion protein [Shewanella sp. 202IG2-18]|uniref:type IV secretion system protein n=1 Tax=Parashewanella hymeniacidonis TaxID=2807618 RepID=UPI00196159D0|nr:type IV secretion system protein [Parashewanella hymeniacidonis]MBM7070726.1 type IV secretion protein [Parashewanella hymeniacidonis]
MKSLVVRTYTYGGKIKLVIPACCKREYSLRPPYKTGVQRPSGLLSCAFFFSFLILFFAVPAHAFPVIDVANLHQNIIQVKHLLEEINTLKQQLSTAKDQLKSINGVRGMGNAIDSVYDISVKVDPNLTLKQQGLHNSQELQLGSDVAGLYDDINRYRGRWFGQTQLSLQQTQARYQQLMRLIQKINQAPQQKDIEDLQARIDAEGVMLQNEQAKLQLLNAQAQASEALTQQKITQMAIESGGELHLIHWNY